MLELHIFLNKQTNQKKKSFQVQHLHQNGWSFFIQLVKNLYGSIFIWPIGYYKSDFSGY